MEFRGELLYKLFQISDLSLPWLDSLRFNAATYFEPRIIPKSVLKTCARVFEKIIEAQDVFYTGDYMRVVRLTLLAREILRLLPAYEYKNNFRVREFRLTIYVMVAVSFCRAGMIQDMVQVSKVINTEFDFDTLLVYGLI